ncbi:hypothetical protein AGMMS50230_01820 [Spirochaetia bacterium]|nr:hypothetical protein AGMMS50230_01820 [Spirochaetia bacterium]
MNKRKRSSLKFLLLLTLLTLSLTPLASQTASRIDGGGTILYYATLAEAFAAAEGLSLDYPDEITLLADIILAESILVDTTRHIRLVPGGGSRHIMRDSQNISNPLLRVTGEGASLSLGKPGMEYELFIDGGYLLTPPIQAEAPLVVINGPDAKLFMYDKVTLQNNYNGGKAKETDEYQNGAGVFIRTTGNDKDRQTEFIMKGGTIRGNISNARNILRCGGGVLIAGFGIFTMEGGTIAGNTARLVGGGFHTGSRGSFKKTGGIIYGSDAADELANLALEGFFEPKIYGNAVSVSQLGGIGYYRDDTVTEDSVLSYTGHDATNGVFGAGEKWSTSLPPSKSSRIFIIPIAAILAAFALFIVFKKRSAKVLRAPAEAADQRAQIEQIAIEMKLSTRETEVFTLLLTEAPVKQIAHTLKISYSGVNFHTKNLYRKLGIQSRTELFAKFGKK